MSDLPVLISRVLGQLSTDAEPPPDSGAPSIGSYSNLLRCVGPSGVLERDLPTSAKLSKRLATTAVNAAVGAGWITAEPAKGKRRTLTLTDSGMHFADEWADRLARLDERWSGSGLRRSVERLVAGLPYELPRFPASYGSADPSAIGGPFVQHSPRRQGVPAHGADWRPVPRGAGDTVSHLPVTALLSQALMAFTIDYEDRFPWPLASTANVLRHIGKDPTPLSQLPEGHGITGHGKSLLERHLIVSVADGAVALTDRGEQVLSHHPARLEATEAIWRERHGDAVVDELRDHLRGVASTAPSRPRHLMWSGET